MHRKNIFTVLSVFVTVFTHRAVSYEYFGTKTSYFVNGNTDDSLIQVEGCKPALFWNLARHGTRNPGDDDILEMAEKLPALREQIVKTWEEGGGTMEKEDVLLLMNWTFDLHVEDDSLLTESGKLEHRQMGQRWGQRLGDLVLDKGKTEVRSSNKSRCVESGEAFLQGLFESDLPHIIEDNRFLRFYDYCLKFINEVDDNNETFVESIKFTAGEVFQEMVNRVNSKTGLPLDIPEIRLMYDMCRYEKAWFPSAVSLFCLVFSDEDLKLLEFQQDLKYYYNDGAAFNITADMTQPLFADIFHKIQEVQSSQEANTSILNFAHSGTLQTFMTALGLYKDQEDLLVSDWGTPKEDHKWQVSKIASFATNVGLVVFECNKQQEEDDSSEENYSSEADDSSEEDASEKGRSERKKSEEKSSKETSSEEKSSEEKSSEEKSSEEKSSDKKFTDEKSSEEKFSEETSSEEKSSEVKSSEETSEEKSSEETSSEEKSSEEYFQDKKFPKSSEWKVMLYHQEKAVIQPACGAKVCLLDEFLKAYRYLAEQDFDAVCEN